MSWNIQKPGDFINGPLTVAGVAQFNSNVGVGVTPSAWSGISGKVIEFGSSASNNSIWGNGVNDLHLVSNSFFNGSIWIYNKTASATRYNQLTGAHVWYNAVSGTAGNAVTWVQALTLNSNGALVLQGGNTAANGVGITFPSAQSASTDANTLDDYEEGTWTPTLTFSTPGTLSTTYSIRTARYTKVGNLVTVSARVEFAPGGFVKGTATGTMILSGLPFATANSLQFYADFAASLADQSAGSLMFFTNPGGVTSLFSESISVSGTKVIRDFAPITHSNFAASNAGFMSLPITFSYYV
jgi:hypothetical protein